MYTKAQLIKMNKSYLGRNWIKNIGDLGDQEPYIIYPTQDWGVHALRIFIALPAALEITDSVKAKYKLL